MDPLYQSSIDTLNTSTPNLAHLIAHLYIGNAHIPMADGPPNGV